MHVNSLKWVKSFLEHPTTEIPRANSSQVTSQEIIHPQTMHYFWAPLFDPPLIWEVGNRTVWNSPKVSPFPGGIWRIWDVLRLLMALFGLPWKNCFTESEEICLRNMLKWNPNVHRIIKLKTQLIQFRAIVGSFEDSSNNHCLNSTWCFESYRL